MKTEQDIRRQADHLWHVWMNQYADSVSKKGQPRPHSLYEFKDLLQFLEWGWKRIEQAYTGNLPSIHRQCSRSPAEQIQNNCLKCVLGTDVTKCGILLSIKSVFDTERERECGQLGKYYAEIPDSEIYRCMAKTCAWHIYTKVVKAQEGFFGFDTSEGHLLDVSDKMFWERTYSDPEGKGEST